MVPTDIPIFQALEIKVRNDEEAGKRYENFLEAAQEYTLYVAEHVHGLVSQETSFEHDGTANDLFARLVYSAQSLNAYLVQNGMPSIPEEGMELKDFALNTLDDVFQNRKI
tara:strand:- start:409 stop:741 length:333 start_codon:yes stop_codon:yes gene_type:complete